MFRDIFAVCLLVKDFKVSLSFYQKTLGLKLNSQNGQFADFNLDGTSLAIFEQSEATAMLPRKYMASGGGAVIAFQVESLTKTVKDLHEKGITFISGPKTTPWGQKVAYFLDPDKNIWEISET